MVGEAPIHPQFFFFLTFLIFFSLPLGKLLKSISPPPSPDYTILRSGENASPEPLSSVCFNILSSVKQGRLLIQESVDEGCEKGKGRQSGQSL